MNEQYRIDNFSNPCPFTVIVEKEHSAAGIPFYRIKMTIGGKWYSRVEDERLKAIIIAKDIARALEDAFRNTFEDNS